MRSASTRTGARARSGTARPDSRRPGVRTIRSEAYRLPLSTNQRPSPTHSDAISARSAFIPSRTWRKPCDELARISGRRPAASVLTTGETRDRHRVSVFLILGRIFESVFGTHLGRPSCCAGLPHLPGVARLVVRRAGHEAPANAISYDSNVPSRNLSSRTGKPSAYWWSVSQ